MNHTSGPKVTFDAWRTCKGPCEQSYPLSHEFFGSNYHYAGGYDLYCKMCRWDKRKVSMKRRALAKALAR